MPISEPPVTVEKWMTKDLMTVQPDTPLDSVYRIMAIRDIRHMPIVKEGQFLGLVTKEDVMRELTRVQATLPEGQTATYPPVSIALSQAVTIHPDAYIGSATALLLRHKASALAVVNEAGRLVGLITESDIFRLVMMFASDVPPRQLVTLKSGLQVYIRAVRPDDAQVVQSFYNQLSEESNYLRFLTYRRMFPLRDMRKMTTFDYESQISFVAVLPREPGKTDEIVGITEYAPIELEKEGMVEFAITIADAYQGHGLGTVLLHHLVAYGRERGIKVFYGMVRAENKGMVHLIQKLGVRYEVKSMGEVQEFYIYIQEPTGS
jgi:CBS domain-containing protein/GNAT superfamily N-acetyltransferase